MSPHDVQQHRLQELLRRQLGAKILSAIEDPKITEIIVNEDGRVWFESYDRGLHEGGLSFAPSQIESLIGTVAASLRTVVNPQNPIVAVDLPFYAYLFAALIAGVVIGGAATWLSQGKWRRIARVRTHEALRWRAEAERLTRERDASVAERKQLAVAGR